MSHKGSKKRGEPELTTYEVSFGLQEKSCDNLLRIPIKLNNQNFEAVVDTGSTISFVNSKTTYLLGIDGNKDKEILIKLLDQKLLRISETVDVKIQYKNKSLQHKFYLFWRMKYPVLLGLDILKRMKIQINFEEQFYNPFENIEFDNTETETQNNVIRLEEDLIIEPRQEIVVFELENIEGIAMKFIPHVNNLIKYNKLTKVVYQPDVICVVLINNNFSKLYLPKGLQIGTYSIEDNLKTQKEICLNITRTNIIPKLKIIDKNAKLLELIEEFSYIFAEDIAELKRALNIKHIIDTGDAQPFRSVPYRTSFKEKEIIEKEVNKMLKNKIISVSHSPWSSPVVLVTKKDGSTRFCIDYRKLNSITKKDCHPLPLIADTIDQLNNANVFSKLDLISGYWNIEMEEKSKEKTAFVCHLGLFHFNRMPFGLTNAPSSFQRYLSFVLNEYLWRFVLVYIDDLIIYSNDMEEHIKHIRLVFEKLAEFQLRLKVEKCEFATEEVAYLGHVISKNGVKPDPDKIRAIENFQRPRKVRDLRGWLGLTSYYRRFVKSYSQIAKPLNLLLKKNAPFVWNEDCEISFNELKQKLVTPPILSHFKPGCEIILYVDACDYSMGCVLSQIQDGKEVVISYNSKSMDERQQRYSVCEKELLAIVWAIQKLRHYLFGTHFTVKTDNNALTYIMNTKSPNGRLMRWSLLLQEFDFTIEYRSGKVHKNADFMSRHPDEEPDSDVDEINFFLVEDLKIAEEQKEDKWIQSIVKEIKEKKNKKFIIAFRIENDILYRVIYTTNREPLLLLVVPKSLRLRILKELHCDQLSSHQGFLRTYVKVRSRFWWKSIERSVRDFVRKCPECQLRKSEQGLPKGNLQSIEYVKEPFYFVAMDICGSLVMTPRKNQYIIVFVDLCTKYMEAKPLKNIRSETVAEFFINEIVVRHGAVVKILTDQGRNFCSEFMETVFKMTKTEHLTTTAYNPQCNGLAERCVKSIRFMLSLYINENHTNWDLYLSRLVFSYNTSKQSSTGETPFFLLYGRECRLPIDVTFDLPNRFRFGRRFKESMDKCMDLVKIRVTDAQQRQKVEYDARHWNTIYSVGDLVAMRKHTRVPGKSEKLFKSWEGPYQIVRKIGPNTYELKNVRRPKRKLKKVNIQHLKRWYHGVIEGLEDPDHFERDFRDNAEKLFQEEDALDEQRKQRARPATLKDFLGDDLEDSSKSSIDKEEASKSGDDLIYSDFSDVKAENNGKEVEVDSKGEEQLAE